MPVPAPLAITLLPLLQNDYARAATVGADDARLAIDKVSYAALGGTPADKNKARDMIGTLDANQTAERIAAAVPQLAAQVKSIQAPLLLHYAGLDTRIGAGIDAYKAALTADHKTFTVYVYPGVNHAFNNDTSSRYDKAAATLAWGRTTAFPHEHLD